jgi:hypothetical protein
LIVVVVVVEVVSLLSDVAKGGSAQSMDLEDMLSAVLGTSEIDVALLASPDAVSQCCDESPGFQIVQCQNVIAGIREAVTIVAPLFGLVADQLVAQQGRDYLVTSTVPKIRKGRHQRTRHQSVILHALFHSLQHSKVIPVHRTHHCRIQLHLILSCLVLSVVLQLYWYLYWM